MFAGMEVTRESTIGGFLHVVFPFKDPISGPNMGSAASMSGVLWDKWQLHSFSTSPQMLQYLVAPLLFGAHEPSVHIGNHYLCSSSYFLATVLTTRVV